MSVDVVDCGSVVLGHHSLGLVPLFVAWAATGWRLWSGQPVGALDPSAAATV